MTGQNAFANFKRWTAENVQSTLFNIEKKNVYNSYRSSLSKKTSSNKTLFTD